MKLIVLVAAFVFLWGGVLPGQVIRAKVPSSSFEKVTILYTANIKGLHAATQTDAPASALQTILSALRKESPDTLLVDLGSFMGPAPTTLLTQGKFDFQVMELLGYDLLHLSSNDFVIGAENLNVRIADTTIPVLTGNLNVVGSGGSTWTILACGSRKVGFVGLTSSLFDTLVMAKMRKGVIVESATDYLERAIREMAGKADIVVALTDLPEDQITSLRSLPGLDLILTTGGDAVKQGGDWLSVGFPGKKSAAIARTLSPGIAIHVLEIHGFPDQNKWTIDEIVGDVYTINQNTPRENATDNWIQWQQDASMAKNSKVLGELKQPLSSLGGRSQQTPLGRMATSLMRNYTRSHVAILRSGALRKALPQGPITEWDLIDAVPDPSDLVVITMTGAEIEALMAKSLKKVGEDGYLQFSGVTVDPFGLDNRIGGLQIAQNREYTVTLSDFLAQGGDGYDELKTAHVVQRIPATLPDLFRQAFQRDGTLRNDLPEDKETNFWFAKFHLGATLNGFVADPTNLSQYPDQVDLIGAQLLNSSLNSRLDVDRKDFSSGFENFISAGYGRSWDPDWKPIETQNNFQMGSQYSLYLSNLLFGGVKTLDPYASAILETALIYPDPSNELFDYSLPRPGSLRLAAGVEETALLKPAILRLGIRWEKQPFDWDVPAVTGLEGLLSDHFDIVEDVLSFDTSTEAFSAFDYKKLGVSISSMNQIYFALGENLKIGPRIHLFYNTVVKHLAYLFDVSVSMDFTFGGN